MVIYNYNTALLFIAPAVRYFNRAPPGGCGPHGPGGPEQRLQAAAASLKPQCKMKNKN